MVYNGRFEIAKACRRPKAKFEKSAQNLANDWAKDLKNPSFSDFVRACDLDAD